MDDIQKLRNIGISAHIDAGKTTLTERILYYTKRIYAVHEVKGKDGVGAKMDFMELERERGITISSAATHCEWNGYQINVIDTPGHVDFTVEVERSLRVLDGSILVMCAVGGVQSQSISVDRQMNRYKVPRLVFVNKCDRSGADPYRVVEQIGQRLNHNAVLVQIPIGLEKDFSGVIDLISMKAVYFGGSYGEELTQGEIPPKLMDEALARREELLDAASMLSDELMTAVLEERTTEELIHDAVRKGVHSGRLIPVFLGSAYKNIGVQLLLEGITRYLPSPKEVENTALDLDEDLKEIVLSSNSDDPFVGLAFKLEVTPYGQLTYLRIYQGAIEKGIEVINTRSRKKIKIGRLVKVHADEMEDITCASAGDIVALFGVECFSGDTFTDGRLNCMMPSMLVPEPVISLSVTPKTQESEGRMSKALSRFTKEDPTFRFHIDEDSDEPIISGMGELHLEIYVERMKREFGAEVDTGVPQVAYREAISLRATFDYTHKKQTGGAGQYGRVAGFMEPMDEGGFEFVNRIKGGAIPTQFVLAVEKGFRSCLKKGPLAGFPVVGLRVTINDGQSHSVDSSDRAFHEAAFGAFRQAYSKAAPMLIEPLMKVVVECPSEFQGSVLASFGQRRGRIVSAAEYGVFATIEAEVPLETMFGYSTTLRSMTQGKGEFTMEFSRYAKAPESFAEEVKKRREKGGKN